MAYANRFYTSIKRRTKADRRIKKHEQLCRFYIKRYGFTRFISFFETFGEPLRKHHLTTFLDEFYEEPETIGGWVRKQHYWLMRRGIKVDRLASRSSKRYLHRLISLHELVWGEDWPDIGRMSRREFKKFYKKHKAQADHIRQTSKKPRACAGMYRMFVGV